MGNIITKGLGGADQQGPQPPVVREGIRFLGNNYITDPAMITLNNFRPGITEGSQKDGSGSAVMTIGGAFTGDSILKYVIEIDAIGTGEVGSSTFKWSDDGGVTWDATGVTTSAGPITLNNGITVSWASGTGADFALADTWTFWTAVPFGKQHLIDFERMPVCDTGSTSVNIVINIGVPVSPEAFGLINHNLPLSSSITLEANTSDSWVSPAYSGSMTTMLNNQYFNIGSAAGVSYQYWRVVISGAGSDIQIGELYLGDQVEVFDFSYPYKTLPVFSESKNEILESYQITGPMLTRAAAYELRDLFKGLWDDDILNYRPCLIFDPDTPDRAYYCRVELTSFSRDEVDWHSLELDGLEVPRYA